MPISRPLFAISMRAMRLTLKIIKTLVKDRLYYPGRLVADLLTLLVRCGLLLVLYSYVFKLNNGQIRGQSYSVAAWSIFFYFIFLTLRLRDIPQAIMDDVKSGNIEMLLTKPFSYLYYRIIWQIGSGLYPFLVLCTTATTAMLVLVGLPATSGLTLLFSLPVSFFLCLVLTSLLYSVLGLMAFWIEDILPLQWMLDKLIMALAGAYVPIAFLPKALQTLAIYSPFGAAYSIGSLAYPAWLSAWPKLFMIQIFWILFVGIVLLLLFRKAERQLSINGG